MELAQDALKVSLTDKSHELIVRTPKDQVTYCTFNSDKRLLCFIESRKSDMTGELNNVRESKLRRRRKVEEVEEKREKRRKDSVRHGDFFSVCAEMLRLPGQVASTEHGRSHHFHVS